MVRSSADFACYFMNIMQKFRISNKQQNLEIGQYSLVTSHLQLFAELLELYMMTGHIFWRLIPAVSPCRKVITKITLANCANPRYTAATQGTHHNQRCWPSVYTFEQLHLVGHGHHMTTNCTLKLAKVNPSNSPSFYRVLGKPLCATEQNVFERMLFLLSKTSFRAKLAPCLMLRCVRYF